MLSTRRSISNKSASQKIKMSSRIFILTKLLLAGGESPSRSIFRARFDADARGDHDGSRQQKSSAFAIIALLAMAAIGVIFTAAIGASLGARSSWLFIGSIPIHLASMAMHGPIRQLSEKLLCSEATLNAVEEYFILKKTAGMRIEKSSRSSRL